MPSASTKVEIPASQEALEPIKKVLTVVDKKVRNLEKRKLKLDTYREKKDHGKPLEADQQNAVDKYGEVVQNLEFARDLQKQFCAISADAEKLLKKQAKRGKSEKQLQEVKRVRAVLQLQGLLDSLGSESVRSDFQSGKHGAIVLTEENLDQLDELYKLISPTRDGEVNYLESLSTASDHIVNLLDAKDKPVVGTTYKELKELLDLIAGCGYFEKAPRVDDNVQEEAGQVEGEFEVVEHQDLPHPDSEEVRSSLPPDVVPTEPLPTPQEPQEQPQTIIEDTPPQQPAQVTNMPAEADSFFSTPVNSQAVQQQQQQQQQQQAELAAAAAAFNNRQRPFQEIVSSVQGSFNFLQESTIEMEAKREFSPHMDPAVVAAHPMPQTQPMVRPASAQNPDPSSSLTQAGFSAPSFGEQSTLDTDISSSATHPASHPASHSSIEQSLLASQPNPVVQSQDFSNSGFTAGMTHTLQTDNLFSGSPPDSMTTNISQNVMGKGPANESPISQYEIPPQIPMPPGHEQGQQPNTEPTQPVAEKKSGYQMNPNASEFQSLIYPQGEEEESNNKQSPDNNNFQGGSFTNSNYNQGRDQRNSGGRGGYRGDRSGRGGNRGGAGNGMTNGFSKGGGRSYDRSGSGGGGYQGYPPRNDYRPDGYQGYGNNNNFGGGYQKRGGGPPRGGNRGGNRGGSGYNNRGGNGGSYRGNRGGNSQGFGRPNFNQQQTAQ